MTTITRTRLTDILADLRELIPTMPDTIERVTAFGDARTEQNRTYVYDAPDYSNGLDGYRVAYVETSLTYRGNDYTVMAYLAVQSARNWMKATGPILALDSIETHNIDKARRYGRFETPTPEGLRAAIHEHMSTILGVEFDEFGHAPITVTKAETIEHVVAAIVSEMNRKPITYYNGVDEATDYARSYRNSVERKLNDFIDLYVYDEGKRGRANGHNLGDDATYQRIVKRVLANHKRVLAARARAL